LSLMRSPPLSLDLHCSGVYGGVLTSNTAGNLARAPRTQPLKLVRDCLAPLRSGQSPYSPMPLILARLSTQADNSLSISSSRIGPSFSPKPNCSTFKHNYPPEFTKPLQMAQASLAPQAMIYFRMFLNI
jgi:hypothetical protein